MNGAVEHWYIPSVNPSLTPELKKAARWVLMTIAMGTIFFCQKNTPSWFNGAYDSLTSLP